MLGKHLALGEPGSPRSGSHADLPSVVWLKKLNQVMSYERVENASLSWYLRKWTYDNGVDHVPPLLLANDFEVPCEYGHVSEQFVQ